MGAPILICLCLLIGLLPACSTPPETPTPVPPTATIAPTATLTVAQLEGHLLKGDTAPVYRLMENGQLRHINDWATFLALGADPGDILTVPPERLTEFPLVLPLTRWLTGQSDTGLYYLLRGKRYLISDTQTPAAAPLRATGGSPLDVVPVPDSFLDSFPLAQGAVEGVSRVEPGPPAITAALWADATLWVADESGRVARWTGSGWVAAGGEFGGAPIQAFASNVGVHYVVNADGRVWRWTHSPGENTAGVLAQLGARPFTAFLFTGDGRGWLADADFYDPQNGYQYSGGLLRLDSLGNTLSAAVILPLRHITALAADPHALWAATNYAGLWRYDFLSRTWQNFNTLNSRIPDDTLNALAVDDAGTVWAALPSGIIRYHDGVFSLDNLSTRLTPRTPLAIAIAPDGAAWASGVNFIARRPPGGAWQTYDAFDQTVLLDDFRQVALDDDGHPWFVGRRHVIHYDGAAWTAYDIQTGQMYNPPPATPAPVVPDPHSDTTAWLQSWPRPADDNGRCLHYLQMPSGDAFEVWQNLDRLEQLGARWTLVNITGRDQLLQMAPIFQQAGIMVVWRPFVRPYQDYPYWAQDVTFLRGQGIAPYIQVYNEPSLGQEWDGQPVDEAVYLNHLLPAVQAVYDAGGYVGLQQIDPEWLRDVLRRLKAAGLERVFDRLFFVPHLYGFNHPPGYTGDINGVLGFRAYAEVFQQEIGFVPPMIAGEGGWRPGEQQDSNYPAVSEALHRDYHLAVFEWFWTGLMSDGQPLPDYLFAFCPWLLSDPNDPAAWFDSATGDRTLTIQAVEALPRFVRRFSWDSPSPTGTP